MGRKDGMVSREPDYDDYEMIMMMMMMMTIYDQK